MNGYELAIVQEKDIGMISCIHTISFDDAWSGAMIRRILAMPGTFGIVAVQSRQWSSVGFVLGRIAADECEILSIAVAPSAGARMSEQCCSTGRCIRRHRGFETLSRVASVTSLTLYDSRGFVPVGRRQTIMRDDGTYAAAVTMSCGRKPVRGRNRLGPNI